MNIEVGIDKILKIIKIVNFKNFGMNYPPV